MNKNIQFKTGSHLFKRTAILLLTCSFLFIACNSKKEEKKEQAGSDTVVKQEGDKPEPTTATAIAPLTGELYTLKLTKVQFDSLQKYTGSKKMVLQFCFIASNAGSPTLLAYPSKAQDKFYPNNTNSVFNPAELAIGQPYMTVAKRMIFGDQEVTYQSINKFLTDNHIDTSLPYTLIFSPDIKTDNHIYYRVTVDGVQTLAGTLETNPSPPKDAE